MNNNNKTAIKQAELFSDGPLGSINDLEAYRETPLDGDGLPELSAGFAIGSIVFNATKGLTKEAPGAIAELWTENLIGIEHKTPQQDLQNPEDQEAVMKQANEAQRVRNFNEQAQKLVRHEIKFAKVAGEIKSSDEILRAAGLSSSFNVINEDGTVDAYTQAVVEEAENILAKKKAEMDTRVDLATGKSNIDLRQNSANEGGSALSATKSAG